MRNRLESFKSAKMGVNPAKKLSKHPKKDSTQKVLDLNVLLSSERGKKVRKKIKITF